MLLNCGVEEDSWESLGLQGDPTILKEISPEYSLEGLMLPILKLKLQYFDYLMRRTYSLEKTLMLGKVEGRRRRGKQRMRCWDGITTQWTWVWVNSGSWWWTGMPGMLQSMGLQRVRHDWVTELTDPKKRILLSIVIICNYWHMVLITSRWLVVSFLFVLNSLQTMYWLLSTPRWTTTTTLVWWCECQLGLAIQRRQSHLRQSLC